MGGTPRSRNPHILRCSHTAGLREAFIMRMNDGSSHFCCRPWRLPESLLRLKSNGSNLECELEGNSKQMQERSPAPLCPLWGLGSGPASIMPQPVSPHLINPKVPGTPQVLAALNCGHSLPPILRITRRQPRPQVLLPEVLT